MRTTTLFPALVLLSGTVLSKTITYDCSIQAGKTSGVGSASPGETIDFVLQNINKLPSGSPDWCAPYNRGSTTCKNDQHQVFFSAQGTFDLDAEDAQSKRDVQVTDVGNTKIIKVRNVAAPFTA
ncbi:hypothetical protein SCUP515_11791 [Seiridium cupressi]